MAPLASTLVLVVLAGAPLMAQQVTAHSAPIMPGDLPVPPKVVANGRISGLVLCGDTRKPARGAMMLVSALPNADGSRPQNEGGRDKMIRIGLDGTYTADHLAPGEYAVTAVFPGYLTPFDDMVSSQMEDQSPEAQRAIFSKDATVVVRGAEVETLNVMLVRGAAISGRVLYSDGSPASQVSIDLENTGKTSVPGTRREDDINIGRAMRSIFTQQSLSTDDQGRFSACGGAAGKVPGGGG